MLLGGAVDEQIAFNNVSVISLCHSTRIGIQYPCEIAQEEFVSYNAGLPTFFSHYKVLGC